MTRILLALLVLAGCAGPPPPVPPTLVTIAATATADANASRAGGGAPVSVRVYQLTSPAGFEGAQFFQLLNGDAAILKDDLVKRDDLLLGPGQSRTLSLAPPDRAQAIGVFAAYRDYEQVAWRAVAPIAAHKTTTMTITAGRAGVSIQ